MLLDGCTGDVPACCTVHAMCTVRPAGRPEPRICTTSEAEGGSLQPAGGVELILQAGQGRLVGAALVLQQVVPDSAPVCCNSLVWAALWLGGL